MDVGGNLYRISVLDKHGIGVVGVDGRSGREVWDGEGGRRRVECARLEVRSVVARQYIRVRSDTDMDFLRLDTKMASFSVCLLVFLRSLG